MKFQNKEKQLHFPAGHEETWWLVSGLTALEHALNSEKKYDLYLHDFIEIHYLVEQVKSVKELGDHWDILQMIKALKSGMAGCLCEKHTQGESDHVKALCKKAIMSQMFGRAWEFLLCLDNMQE